MNNVSMYVARYVCKRSKYYLKREGGGRVCIAMSSNCFTATWSHSA